MFATLGIILRRRASSCVVCVEKHESPKNDYVRAILEAHGAGEHGLPWRNMEKSCPPPWRLCPVRAAPPHWVHSSRFLHTGRSWEHGGGSGHARPLGWLAEPAGPNDPRFGRFALLCRKTKGFPWRLVLLLAPLRTRLWVALVGICGERTGCGAPGWADLGVRPARASEALEAAREAPNPFGVSAPTWCAPPQAPLDGWYCGGGRNLVPGTRHHDGDVNPRAQS